MLKACIAEVAVDSLYRLAKAITQPTGMLQLTTYFYLRHLPLVTHWTSEQIEKILLIV